MDTSETFAPDMRTVDGARWLRWVGVVLLLIVAYVHLALFFRVIGFNSVLGILFLINALGGVFSAVGVAFNSRWAGWIPGMLVAGGAAVVKMAMNTFPSVASLVMHGGRRAGAGHPRTSRFHGGKGNAAAGHHGTGGFHSAPHPAAGHVLPLLNNTQTLATASIAIELIFVAFAIYSLIAGPKKWSGSHAV